MRKVFELMKKNLIRAFASVMALAAVLTLSACGNDSSSSTGSKAASSSVSSTAESSTPVSSAAESSAAESSKSTAGIQASGKFATIDDFVNSDIVQSQLSSMLESMGDDMDISIAGEGDKLIYTFKFAEGTETEGMAEVLEAGMETQASTFEGIASSLKAAVEVENPIVVVLYADSEGNEIYSREFTAAE